MASTKSLYLRWLILYIISLLLSVFLIVLDYQSPVGYIVVAISLILDIYYFAKYLAVKKIEKNCVICEGRFVGAEQTSIGWRSPKFSITIEIESNGNKVLVKTAGVYAAFDISGITTQTMIKVGYTQNFEEVITL